MRRDEGGQVLVFSALAMTALLLVAALAIDAGNWFSHDRQLQTRADAGALAAGVEYAGKWSACIQDSDTTLKAQTAAAIATAARKFAGDPSATNPVNTEVAAQTRLTVVVNSTSYSAGTSFSDGAVGHIASPCYHHPGDSISPAGGIWTDVRVEERDLPSLFGKLGVPLPRSNARARVDIRPALSLNGLLPLAVPDQRIVNAQIRYINECDGSVLKTVNLNPLEDAYQTAAGANVTYWGPRGGAAAGDRVPPTTVTFDSFPTAGCGPADNPWVPIGVQVRLASIPTIDLDQACATLQAAKFADCFQRLSTIRAWVPHATTHPSDPNVAPPQIGDVTLTPPTPCPTGDEYFGRAPDAATTCTPGTVGVTVDVDWGDRDDGPLNDIANFDVTINGTQIPNAAKPANPTGTWVAQTPVTAGSGARDITVRLEWRRNSGTWRGQSCGGGGGGNPCRYDQTATVHRTYVGQGDGDDPNYVGLTEVIRTSLAAQASGGLLGPALGNFSMPPSPNPPTVSFTLGLRSALATGTRAVLRSDDPQGNQTVDCDGSSGNGTSEVRQMLSIGCQPHYGKNPFTTGIWWNDTTKTCPSSNLWYSLTLPTTDQYYNSATNPWRCVPLLPGARSALIDGIMIRTGNCPGYNTTSYVCSPPPSQCYQPNYYDTTLKVSRYPGPGRDPRIVPLFVLPYQALKGAGGGSGGEVVPILGFASFYITGWGGTGSSQDRCTSDPDGSGPARPDESAPSGGVVGYFIADFTPSPGPSDPNANCTLDQLVPCRASLVR